MAPAPDGTIVGLIFLSNYHLGLKNGPSALKASQQIKAFEITCRKGCRDGNRASKGLPHQQHHHQPPHLGPLRLTPSSSQFHFFQHHRSFFWRNCSESPSKKQSLVTLVKSSNLRKFWRASSSQLEVPASTEATITAAAAVRSWAEVVSTSTQPDRPVGSSVATAGRRSVQ